MLILKQAKMSKYEHISKMNAYFFCLLYKVQTVLEVSATNSNFRFAFSHFYQFLVAASDLQRQGSLEQGRQVLQTV